MLLKNYAYNYKKLGINIIATDAHKRALYSWTVYQKEFITDDGIKEQFSNRNAKGLAVICGKVSGNIEVIDIDTKNDITGSLYEDFIQAVMESDPDLISKMVIASTRSGGYHLIYRCPVIEGNQPLARRPATKEEIENNPNQKVLVVLETRGQGGYIAAAPSEGYKFIQGEPKDIPTITEEERDILLSAARSFNTYIEPHKEFTRHNNNNNSYSISPFDDYNNRGDVPALLKKHGWLIVKDNGVKVVVKRPGNTTSKSSGDYNRDLNWFSVFTTSTQFEPNKAYKPCAVFAELECGGDYKLAYKLLTEQGFGKRNTIEDQKINGDISNMLSQGASESEITKHLINNHNLDVAVATEAISRIESNAILKFWDVEYRKKDTEITIHRTKLLQFLQNDGGFYLYFYDKNSNIFRIIRDKKGIIEEASSEQIKKFVKRYISSLPASFDNITRLELLETVSKGAGVYFSDALFEFMDHYSPDFLKDDKDTAYLPFKNGVVCISKDEIKLKSYGELHKCVWKAQVIDHNIDITVDDDPERVDFYRFVCCICGNDPKKIEYAMSLIGYLMHNYKDPVRPYAVILGEESDKSDDGGGTGKGIFVTAVSHIINTQQIDGKNFKQDKSFAFQRVGLDTKLIAIQDIRKNVDFEGYYSLITEGITVERKNKDELYIPYCDSPKILFTTNYTIDNSSNHAARRQRLLEFCDFFNPDNTPVDFFGYRLFEDWDDHQWSLFYNFMFACCQHYLKHGVGDQVVSETGKQKRIRSQFGEEFFSWWVEYTKDGGCVLRQFFGDLYTSFLSGSELDAKEYSKKRFRKGLEVASKTFGYILNDRANSQAGGKHEIWLSNVKISDEKNRLQSSATVADIGYKN